MLGKRYSLDTVADIFRVVGRDILEAKSISPRGAETREIIAPQIIIESPRQRLVFNDDRKFNVVFALIESLMLFSTSNKLKYFSEFNKTMKQFSDDGKTLHGAYGTRISGQLYSIIDKLNDDKDTRQAVLSIYGYGDSMRKTKDIPCTTSMQFLIRDDKLHMIVKMRSNDILQGLQYDIVMFTMLQEAVANTLGINVGYYIHEPSSLHVYKDGFSHNGYEMLESMVNNSKPVGFTNSSNVNEWANLAKVYTGIRNIQSTPLNRTAGEVYRIISTERAFRKGSRVSKDIAFKFMAENSTPEWCKPFVKRWLK